MKPIVFSVTSVDQIERHLQSARQEGSAPTLAIVFSSYTQDLRELSAVFAKFDVEVFGASTSGEITNDEVHENSIAVMLLDISPDAYRLKVFEREGKTSYQVGQNVAEWAKTVYDNPAFMVMSAGLQADGEQIVKGIIDTMEREVQLFGGLAGTEPGITPGTFVFNGSQVAADGVVGLVFDQNTIELHGIAVSGWKGIGTPKTVTKAEGNTVYEIDGEPALDIYNKYLNIATDGSDIAFVAEYPLVLMRDDGSSVMRAAMWANEDRSIVFSGSVPEGAKVRFSISPGSEIIEHAIEQMSEFNQQTPKSDAIVLFSCKARHLALGPMVEDEISGIHKLWNVPLVGFFTFGEIGPGSHGRCDFHNHTLVPVLIHEK
jgi:hypothetical protein